MYHYAAPHGPRRLPQEGAREGEEALGVAEGAGDAERGAYGAGGPPRQPLDEGVEVIGPNARKYPAISPPLSPLITSPSPGLQKQPLRSEICCSLARRSTLCVRTSCSKRVPHSLQSYSYIGIG